MTCQIQFVMFIGSFCQEIQQINLNGSLFPISAVKYYLCPMSKIISSFLSFLLSLPVYFYRYSISPFLRPSCRHIPSCSQYMLDALKIHGPLYGLVMGTGRILRCRPGGTHGYDPVPKFRFRRYKRFSSLIIKYKSENRLKH